MQLENLKDIVAESLGASPDSIESNSSFDSIPNWDSLAHMILIVKIEEHYKVKFTGDEIADMRTIKDAKDLLIKHGI